jgi:hypothetical protein
MPPYEDLLVCGVSTQLHREVKGFDEVIRDTDPNFATSVLRSTSLIRLGFLAVLPRSEIINSIGSISAQRHRRFAKSIERLSHAVATKKHRRQKGFTKLVPLVLLCGYLTTSVQGLLTLAVAAVPTKIATTRMLELPVAFGADADHV